MDLSGLFRGLGQYSINLNCIWQWNYMIFSMHHWVRSMLKMLIVWFTSFYCRWSQKENSSENRSAFCRERCYCFGTKQSSRLKYNGSTLGPMKLHGRWQIKFCLLSFLIRWLCKFFGICLWYMFLVHVLGMLGICTYVYGCKYHHELSYKAPIRGMGVMSLWCYTCYVVMLVFFSPGWSL